MCDRGSRLINHYLREGFQFSLSTDTNGQFTLTSRQALIFFFSIYEALNFTVRLSNEKAEL